jgi:hypothetical protein
MTIEDSSWWFTLVRRVTKPAVYEENEEGEKVLVRKVRTGVEMDYSHQMNRIEKERGNAARMGLQLVVQAAPLSEYYALYTTPSLDGDEVVLYNEQGKVTVARSSLFWNGPYCWCHKIVPVGTSPFAAALAPLVASA